MTQDDSANIEMEEMQPPAVPTELPKEILPCKLDEPPPAKLSETHCVETADPTTPITDFLPYTVNVSFFADDATKERFLLLPRGEKIHIEDDNRWTLPPGAIAQKKFFVQGILTETRFMVRHGDGTWGAYTYVWNADHSDADLAIYTPQAAGVTPPEPLVVGGQPWQVPSTQCYSCHQWTKAAIDTTLSSRGVVGFTTEQLNRPDVEGLENQLQKFEALGLLDEASIAKLHPSEPSTLPRLVDPYVAGAAAPSGKSDFSDLELRARSYLAANCSHCHHPNGPSGGTLDLRFVNENPKTELKLCDSTASTKMPPQYLYPGDPDKSLIYARVRDVEMPPRRAGMGTSHLREDHAATLLLGEWIAAAPPPDSPETSSTTGYCATP